MSHATVRPTRRHARTLLVTGGLLVSLAAMTACGTGQPGSKAAGASPPTATASPVVEVPPPAAAPEPAAPAAEPVAAEPAAAKPVPAKPRKKLIDMRTVDLAEGAPIKVPAGTPCKAGTLRFNGNRVARVKGAEFGIQDYTYNDLNGDGRAELIAALSCDAAKKNVSLLLVASATGPSSYKTIAWAAVSDVYIEALSVKKGKLITYDIHVPLEEATDVREWRLRGGKLVQTAKLK
jgi:hypothetical protein